jgi:hypothetical protein
MFDPLPKQDLRRLIGESLTSGFIAVVLTDGHILMGCLPRPLASDHSVVSLCFNTEDGKEYGAAHVVDIPIEKIADLQIVPLDESCVPVVRDDDRILTSRSEEGTHNEKYRTLTAKDYPNPYARIVGQHNLQIIDELKFKIYARFEEALSKDGIPPEGITLDEDFVLYADWDFFARQVSGSFGVEVGVGVVTATKNLSPSLQKLVIEKLKTSWLGKLQERFSSDPGMVEENILRGNILVPQPAEQTDIEGESCILVMCAGKDGNSSARTYPVLLKLKRLRYPLEFLGLIMSPLVFYGEMLPIPLQVLGETYNTCLLARAIGYVHELPEV